jgi:Ala-tRNA(Pro) deacylase
MAINPRLLDELERQKLPHEVLLHREFFTATQVAQSTHVPGRLFAKPVVIHDPEGGYSMVVVTAHDHVDLDAFQRFTGHTHGRIASETELAQLFPDCEVGAMPPVGHLYDLPTYVDARFRDEPQIYFQAGNHHEVVKMAFSDFVTVARPLTGEFTGTPAGTGSR